MQNFEDKFCYFSSLNYIYFSSSAIIGILILSYSYGLCKRIRLFCKGYLFYDNIHRVSKRILDIENNNNYSNFNPLRSNNVVQEFFNNASLNGGSAVRDLMIHLNISGPKIARTLSVRM